MNNHDIVVSKKKFGLLNVSLWSVWAANRKA